MTLRSPTRLAAGVAVACALVAAVVALAWLRADLPVRCAEGMVSIGPRCCGEGQRLDRGRCSGAPRRCAAGMTVTDSGCLVSPRRAHISGGVLRLGPGDWEAQGSVRPLVEDIHEFEIDAYEVTEARYLECEAARACAPLDHSGEPGRAVSLVSNDEAARFCEWAGGSLPTSSELAFAAGGASSRRYPWGDTGAVCRRAAWGLADGPCGEGATGPELAGSHPDGASPDGVYDLAGNVAEWTLSTDPRADRADVRGGSFRDGAAAALRSWSRRTVDLANAAHRVRSVDIGFRCVYRSAAPSTPDSDAAKDRDRVH